MRHPKRHMRDGTATTMRLRGVVQVQQCGNPYHAECWEAVTSWAGDTTPRLNPDWHAYFDTHGHLCLLGSLVGRETSQWQTGLKRRVLNARKVAQRLEYLRGEIRAERISWSELAELQGLARHIDPSDMELREWTGIPEHDNRRGHNSE